MFGNDISEYDVKAELAVCYNKIASVYLTQHRTSREFVALKKYTMDRAKEESASILDEILAMRQFNHQNLLPFYTAFVKNLDLYVIAPLMCYGSCKDALNRAFVTGKFCTYQTFFYV